MRSFPCLVFFSWMYALFLRSHLLCEKGVSENRILDHTRPRGGQSRSVNRPGENSFTTGTNAATIPKLARPVQPYNLLKRNRLRQLPRGCQSFHCPAAARQGLKSFD
jgi:hypothetical protein